MKKERLILICIGFFISYFSFGQTQNSTAKYLDGKVLPKGYEKEALTALSHFPELKQVPIKFRIKHSVSTLKTRPVYFSFFMPKGNRSYVIFISDHTSSSTQAVMFQALPFEARVGVLGHELSHIVDFSSQSFWQSLKSAVGHLSQHYLDKMEYHTDEICIQHGLGNELMAWSSFIRKTMHVTNWRGAACYYKGISPVERYMNPGSIATEMKSMKLEVLPIQNAH